MATAVDITHKMDLPAAETHSKGHLTATKDTLLLPTINHNSVVQHTLLDGVNRHQNKGMQLDKLSSSFVGLSPSFCSCIMLD
jgi:hypothetical protein